MTAGDADRVRELLGREPQGRYEIVVRDDAGDPVVLRNAPFLDDGTPMPTRYWLIGPDEVRRIGRLEAAGGVDAAEAAIDPADIEAAHARYAAERDAEIPRDHVGPRPTGGVGGTRVGLKCLHAHWAWHLAGGDDPVGRWIEQALVGAESAADAAAADTASVDTADTASVVIGDTTTTVRLSGCDHAIPWGVVNLTDRWLDGDPPRPEALTNSLGTITDHLDDIVRAHASILSAHSVDMYGDTIGSLARVELGTDIIDGPTTLGRDAAEEIFRMLATESSRDRAHNPGLPSVHVGTIVATCCIVLAVMRRLHLGHVTLHAEPEV